jgi:hypothetical protein
MDGLELLTDLAGSDIGSLLGNIDISKLSSIAKHVDLEKLSTIADKFGIGGGDASEIIKFLIDVVTSTNKEDVMSKIAAHPKLVSSLLKIVGSGDLKNKLMNLLPNHELITQLGM